MRSTPLLKSASTLFTAILLAACSGGGGGGNGGGTPVSADPVEASLNAMSIDTTETPRVDDDQDPLPDSYSPLGAKADIDKFDEIALLGMQLSTGATVPMAVFEEVPTTQTTFTTSVLHAPDATAAPWTGGNYIRAGARADIDDDGYEELLIVYQDHSAINNPVQLVVVEDKQAGFAASTPKVVSNQQAEFLGIAAGDFNGDGAPEAAVVLMQTDGVRIIFLENADGVLDVSTQAIVLPQTNVNAEEIQGVVEVGNLDYDNAEELAVVVNEYENQLEGSGNVSNGTSRYYIYDDRLTGFDLLDDGVVTAVVNNAAVSVVVGDVAIGDVDGDAVDEVVLGGMTAMGTTAQVDNIDYLVYVLDDAKRDLAPLAATVIDHDRVGNDSESGTNRYFNFLHINAADVDGDGAKEIQANEYVFQNLRAVTTLQRIPDYDIPSNQLLFANTSGSFWFNWRTSSVVAANVMSMEGGREQIVFSSESFSIQKVQIWGLHPVNGWSEMHEIPVNFPNTPAPNTPQIIPVNVDTDTMGLKYSEGSYRFVFTEPIVIAALAAAPCGTNIGQDVDSCRTAFGKGTSTTTNEENAWNVTGGVSLGIKTGVPNVWEVEVIASVEGTLRKFTSTSYTLTKRVTYQTGPIEDSVIFVSLPMDIYTYTILSHPDPAVIGGVVEVRMPRSPVTQMVTREVYNANVVDGSVKIDNAIFTHTEGNPSSYPTVAQKNSLLNQFAGLETDEVTVGEGSGNVTVELNVFQEDTTGTYKGWQVSLEVKGTKGIGVGGFKIGYGQDSTVSLSQGEESIYEGSVGQIGAAFFPASSYNFGLFSYVYEVPSSEQRFEVLNYWVN
jgi:hypothetical protein